MCATGDAMVFDRAAYFKKNHSFKMYVNLFLRRT